MLPFGGLTFADDVTQGTWVRAIKGPFRRFAKRILLGVLQNHPCPGNRLQRDPLQTERETERQDSSEARSSSKHGRMLTSQSIVSKSNRYKLNLYKRKPFASSGEGFRRLIVA